MVLIVPHAAASCSICCSQSRSSLSVLILMTALLHPEAAGVLSLPDGAAAGDTCCDWR